MNSRETDINYLKMAFAVAKNGTCRRRKVGCVIVIDGNYIAGSGWNTCSADDVDTCEQRPSCVMRSDDTGPHCAGTVHAELMASANAMKNGVKDFSDATLYIVTNTCLDCAKFIAMVGIRRVVFCDGNPNLPEEFKTLLPKNMQFVQINKKFVDLPAGLPPSCYMDDPNGPEAWEADRKAGRLDD